MYYFQLSIVLLQILGLGISLEQHGKPKEGYHNATTSVIVLIINSWLLYEAGAYSLLAK